MLDSYQKNLNRLQKRRRVEVAKKMLDKVAGDPTFINALLLLMRRGFMNLASNVSLIDCYLAKDASKMRNQKKTKKEIR